MTSDVDRLLEVRDLVAREDGWRQGSSWDGRGRYCLNGAVWVACGVEFPRTDRQVFVEGPIKDRADRLVVLLLRSVWGDPPWPGLGGRHALTGWNDEPGRTQREVVALVEDAIRRAKEAGHDD